VTPIYDAMIPVYASLPFMVLGLILCRRIRRTLVVE